MYIETLSLCIVLVVHNCLVKLHCRKDTETQDTQASVCSNPVIL